MGADPPSGDDRRAQRQRAAQGGGGGDLGKLAHFAGDVAAEQLTAFAEQLRHHGRQSRAPPMPAAQALVLTCGDVPSCPVGSARVESSQVRLGLGCRTPGPVVMHVLHMPGCALPDAGCGEGHLSRKLAEPFDLVLCNHPVNDLQDPGQAPKEFAGVQRGRVPSVPGPSVRPAPGPRSPARAGPAWVTDRVLRCWIHPASQRHRLGGGA